MPTCLSKSARLGELDAKIIFSCINTLPFLPPQLSRAERKKKVADAQKNDLGEPLQLPPV